MTKKRRRQFQTREIHSTRTISNSEAPTTVLNLFGSALSEAQINLMSKGLSLCPTPHHIEKKQILDDLKKFFRQLHLKEFFMEEKKAEEESDTRALFCPPSKYMPRKRRDAGPETYTKETRTDVECQLENLQTKRCKNNLPPEERSALKHLRQHFDIIINLQTKDPR